MIGEWAGLAAAGGISAFFTAAIGFAVFWLNRGKAEGKAEGSEQRSARQIAELFAGRDEYRRDLEARFAGLHGVVTMHHDEMLRDYVRQEHLAQFESRFLGAQKDIGDRLSTEIRSLGDRLDKRIDKLNGVH